MPPYTLSDPYHDFDSKEERAWLDAITAKQGKGITASDLHWVFQGYLPAGTYAECCSYLRPLYDFLHSEHSYHDLWENLVEVWVPMHIKELRADGTLQAVLGEICSIFEEKLELYLRGEVHLGDMELWTVSYLYCTLLEDRHEALLARLQQSLPGRMLMLALCGYERVQKPDNMGIMSEHGFYFRTPESVAAQIKRAQGYSDIRVYLAGLEEEVLEAAESGTAPESQLMQWDNLLSTEDTLTMHLPGGPLYTEN